MCYRKVPTWYGPWVAPFKKSLTLTTPTVRKLHFALPHMTLKLSDMSSSFRLAAESYSWAEMLLEVHVLCYDLPNQHSLNLSAPHWPGWRNSGKINKWCHPNKLGKRPVPLHKSICELILPTDLMNSEAKPGYTPQHFHQLCAKGNGLWGSFEPDGSDFFYFVANQQMQGTSTDDLNRYLCSFSAELIFFLESATFGHGWTWPWNIGKKPVDPRGILSLLPHCLFVFCEISHIIKSSHLLHDLLFSLKLSEAAGVTSNHQGFTWLNHFVAEKLARNRWTKVKYKCVCLQGLKSWDILYTYMLLSKEV